MLIRIMYKTNKYDMVKPYFLERLILAGKIKSFLRSEGWATIGIDRLRGQGGSYEGPERRDLLRQQEQ